MNERRTGPQTPRQVELQEEIQAITNHVQARVEACTDADRDSATWKLAALGEYQRTCWEELRAEEEANRKEFRTAIRDCARALADLIGVSVPTDDTTRAIRDNGEAVIVRFTLDGVSFEYGGATAQRKGIYMVFTCAACDRNIYSDTLHTASDVGRALVTLQAKHKAKCTNDAQPRD